MYARGRYAALKPLATATGNGLMTSATYDGVERPPTIKTGTASTPTSVQNLGYGWDTVSVGNLTTRDDNLNNVHEAYCYDGLHQLGLITETGATTQTKTFAYMPNITAPTDCNAVHNTSSDGTGRLGWKSDVGVYTYSGGPHQVQSVSGGAAFGSLTYDADGSTLTTPHYTSGWPGLTITWTSFDKASSESQTSTSTTLDYAYDAAHRRIQQRGVVSGTTTTFFQDRHARFEEVTVGSTTTWRDYVTGPDGTIGNAYGSGTSYALYYLHGDHQGSVTALSAGSGTSTCWAYDAWGKRRLCNGSDGPVSPPAANDRGYIDQQEIDPVELVNLNARDYDPAMGRMLSVDPAGLRAGPNPYAYSGNNPATKSDPTGFDDDGCPPGLDCIGVSGYQDPRYQFIPNQFIGAADPLGRANGSAGGNHLGSYTTSNISAASVGAPTTGSAQGEDPTPGVEDDSITVTSAAEAAANIGGLWLDETGKPCAAGSGGGCEYVSSAESVSQGIQQVTVTGQRSTSNGSINNGGANSGVYYPASSLGNFQNIANYPSGFGPNYRGPTFGTLPKWGKANQYYPSGRILTGKIGDAVTALADADNLVILNGGQPIGDHTIGDVIQNMVPGWISTLNPESGQYINVNIPTGITLRLGIQARLDVPSGSLIAPGVAYTGGVPESVHYYLDSP